MSDHPTLGPSGGPGDRGRWSVGESIRLPALMAGRDRCAATIELQVRFELSIVHATRAHVLPWVRGALRSFLAQNSRSRIRLEFFIRRALVSLLGRSEQLVFEIPYLLRQGVLILQQHRICLLEAHACVLNIKQSIQHSGSSFGDLGRVTAFHCHLGQVDGRAHAANGAGDGAHIDHESSPNVEKGCVRTPDSTLRGNGDGEGGYA